MDKNRKAREEIRRKTSKYREKRRKRQIIQRLTNPGVNGNTRGILGAHNYLKLYEEMLEAQEGKCKICGRDATSYSRRLHMDHCHKSGRMRGLLCYSCNGKLGWVEKYLQPIVKYLRSDLDWLS